MSIKFDKAIIQNQVWAISLFVIAWSLKPFPKIKWMELASNCECAQSIETSILSNNYHSVLDAIFGLAILGFIAGLICSKGYKLWVKFGVSVFWVVLFIAVNPIFR